VSTDEVLALAARLQQAEDAATELGKWYRAENAANRNHRARIADLRRGVAQLQSDNERSRAEANDLQARVNFLEQAIVSARREGRLMGHLVLECPRCEGKGYRDAGACGDPDCCGDNPGCDYCDSTGNLLGRWPSV